MNLETAQLHDMQLESLITLILTAPGWRSSRTLAAYEGSVMELVYIYRVHILYLFSSRVDR